MDSTSRNILLQFYTLKKTNFMRYDYPGGCEDPRVIQTEYSLYVMVYTSCNYHVARLNIAFSKDLINWDKKGTTFAEDLVYNKSKWFLYYGTEDSYVGVAIANK